MNNNLKNFLKVAGGLALAAPALSACSGCGVCGACCAAYGCSAEKKGGCCAASDEKAEGCRAAS